MKKLLCFMMLLGFIRFSAKAQEIAPVAMARGIQADSTQAADLFPDQLERISAGREISFFPNPVSDHLWLVINTAIAKTYHIVLLDMNGNVLLRQDYPVEAGAHKYFIPLPGFTQDIMMYLRVTDSANSMPVIFRVMAHQ